MNNIVEIQGDIKPDCSKNSLRHRGARHGRASVDNALLKRGLPMNTIMEIQGYTLDRHNNGLMIEDLELGRRLGYERPHSIRKVIRKMLGIGQVKPQEVFSIWRKPGTAGSRPWTTHYLNEARKLIDRMLARGQIRPDGVFAKTSKPIGGGRPWTPYYLNEAHR